MALAHPRRRSPGVSQSRAAWLFLAPSLLVLAAFVAYPMIRAGYLSFTKYNLLQPPRWVGADNYVKAVNDPQVANAVINTAVYATASTVIGVALALLTAVALHRQFFLRGFARTSIFLPFIVSMGVVSIAWQFLLNPEIGLLAHWLRQVGLGGNRGWLRDPSLAMIAVIAVGIWKNLGFYVVIYLAGLVGVPRELYEAASVDGAGPVRQFFSVTLPLLANQTTLIAIVATITNVQVFDQIYVMTQGGPFFKTETLVMMVYRVGFTKLDFGYASAISFILLLVLLVISLGQLAYFRRKEVTY